MLSQWFVEYFWTYTLKIVLTYTPTQTLLEGLQALGKQCFGPLWSVTIHSSWCSKTVKVDKQLEIAVHFIL